MALNLISSLPEEFAFEVIDFSGRNNVYAAIAIPAS
jgi:hypothetical protein